MESKFNFKSEIPIALELKLEVLSYSCWCECTLNTMPIETVDQPVLLGVICKGQILWICLRPTDSTW